MNYNAVITFDSRDAKVIDAIMDALKDHHVAATSHPLGYVQATITLPADTVRQATTTALALADTVTHPTRGFAVPVLSIEVLPTDVFDAMLGVEATPELLSVTQAAEQLKVSPQAVRERLERGTLPGIKIGATWAVYAAAL